MSNWKLSDIYGTTFPKLTDSILDLLVFTSAQPAATGASSFTGTIDVNASGVALETLAVLLGQDPTTFTIDVGGSITVLQTKLKIVLWTNPGAKAKTDGVTGIPTAAASATNVTQYFQAIPKLGSYAQYGYLVMNTSVLKTGTAEPTDVFDINVGFKVGSGTTFNISSGIPMNGGFMIITGAPTDPGDVSGLSLSGLESSLESLTGGSSGWLTSLFSGINFPPVFNSITNEIALLGISMTLYLNLTDKTFKPTSATLTIGVEKFELLADKLYFDPIELWITVPLVSGGTNGLGVQGTIALCSSSNPGNVQDADFDLNFGLSYSSSTFNINAALKDNNTNATFSTLVQDLTGSGNSISVLDGLTPTTLSFQASAAVAGKSVGVNDFSFDVGMDATDVNTDFFGTDISLDSFEVSFEYSAS